jgi:putative flippase GtrA
MTSTRFGSFRTRRIVAFLTCLIGLGLTTLVTTVTASFAVTSALVALVGANIVAGSARFVFLRWWLARRAL